MRTGILVLALIGLAAVVWRLAGALFVLARRGTDSLIVSDVAGARATRGDLTGMFDAQSEAATLRAHRRRAAGRVLLWLVLLVAPSLTTFSSVIYALYSPLWLLRSTRRPYHV